MITKKQISENVLIAEFYELKKYDKDYYKWEGFGSFRKEGLMYHCDFSWLMKVWEKIESIPEIQTAIRYTPKEKHMVSIHTYIDGQGTLFLGEGYSKKSKIDAMYDAIVQFIRWYNKEKKLYER